MKKLDKTLIKGIIALAAIIVMVSLIARFWGKSETLADYAAKHPEQQISLTTPAVTSPQASPEMSPAASRAKNTSDAD
ncbi:MAG: hypothetical protein IKQ83_07440 [Lachnospiraceae bacterium]|nr:hypothetical protein [Lachnospiraceae bacterium]